METVLARNFMMASGVDVVVLSVTIGTDSS